MAQDIVLKTTDDSLLNARVELNDQGLALHSRSGTNRNRDYRAALEMILSRLTAASVPYNVYLDSGPVRDKPLNSRQLAFRSVPRSAQFDMLVKAMNAGSASNGAWRRILTTADDISLVALGAIVQGKATGEANEGDGRLPAAELAKVTPAHVDKAVQQVLAGNEPPGFAPSRDFDILTPDGDRLAPKKVFGAALTLARGIAATPQHFSAGLGTPCFRIIEPVDPDMAAAEGARRPVTHLRRERKPALAAAKRRAMIAELGYLRCERCGLIPGQTLGKHGDAVIEVHHADTQIGAMSTSHVTQLSELRCLRANCHRIVHRELAAHLSGAN